MLKYLTRLQIIEGIIASIVFPLLYMNLKKYLKSYFLRTMIAWFLTWVIRKIGYNTFEHYYNSLDNNVKNTCENKPMN